MRVQVRIRSVGAALRFAESVLLAPGQQHARRNAWTAVCENRAYAADRRHNASAAVAAGAPARAAGTPARTPGAKGTTGPRSARS